ncbi:hypothetical protein [Streptomyces sp. TLI_171]|uniref:hypothetical protein n=1 Tax=Streptomyces sp. TLI_171 TaxID=1938859 RepID=UPI000C18856D|nr:hypothetical protein [Streptomyces sp. TLI_171]RKE22316.1 hypothetical protein BX266_5759 [Streptomyces sp. TLI_171]
MDPQDLQTDFFRAADETAVQLVMAEAEQPPAEVFDTVRARRIDPTTVLPHLVAAALGHQDPAADGPDRSVWPTGPQPWDTEGPGTPVDFEDPWMTGPWVVQLTDDTRDALAGIERRHLPELTSRWARTEELKTVEPTQLMTLIHHLSVLARRARKAEQHLYCALTA